MKLLGYGLCFLSIMAVAVIASNNTDSDLSLVASRQSGTSSAAKLRRSLNLNKKRQKIPALSAIVFQRNRILLNYNSGYANIRDKVKLRGNHPFLLASISKIVTATALLQLYERGEFKLNEPVDKYLDFDVKHPRFRGRSITFKMLLTHTSSIDDNSDVMNKHYFDNKDSTMLLEDFLYYYFTPGQRYYNRWDNFRNKRPGTEYWYSNIGTALVGLLVETISGEDFADYCNDNIFKPLKMHNTAWRLDELDQTLVTPYDVSKGRPKRIAHYTFTDYPNGGLRSTTRDMFLFLRAFVNNGRSGRVRVLQNRTVRLMLRIQVRRQNPDMGLQFEMLNSDYDPDVWGHTGDEKGVSTILGFNVKTKIGAIILANRRDADLSDLLFEALEEFEKV